MVAQQVKTAELSPTRHRKLTNELDAKKQYLEALKTGGKLPGGMTVEKKHVNIQQLEAEIVQKEKFLKEAMEQEKLTDVKRNEIVKLHKEIGEKISEMMPSFYQDRLNAKSENREGYWRAIRKHMFTMTSPEYQKLVKEYRRCAALINPHDPDLRDLRKLQKNKHVGD